MAKTQRQKTCLKLAVVFFLIAIGAAYAMVDLVYDSYEYETEVQLQDGIPFDGDIWLFGPKQFDMKEWEHYNRFKYDPNSSTINC